MSNQTTNDAKIVARFRQVEPILQKQTALRLATVRSIARFLLNGVFFQLRKFLKNLNPWLLLIVPACYVSTLGLLKDRYPIGMSYPANAIWGYEWTQQFRSGIWFPRWMENTFSGLGSPTFHFYGPMCMYALMPFTVGLKMTVSKGLLLSTMLALPVLGFGVARMTTELCSPHRRWLAGVAGTLAVMAPYAWLDIYVRGSIAEIWGIAFLPWLLAALFRSHARRDPIHRLPVVVTVALLGLCHPAVLLLAASSIVLCMLITSGSWSEVIVWFRRGMLPMLVGIALAGFYLISAVFDQKYVQVDFLNKSAGEMPTNRLLAGELGRFSTKVSEGFEGEMIPGFLVGAVAVLWVSLLLWRRGHPDGTTRSRYTVFLIGLSTISALMMTDLGKGIYELIPTFNRIQFSWRWLTVYTVAATALWAVVLLILNQPKSGTGIMRMLGWIATIWAATVSLAVIPNQIDWNPQPMREVEHLFAQTHSLRDFGDPSDSPRQISYGANVFFVDAKDKLLYLDVHEYLPLTKRNSGFPPRRFEPVEWASGQGSISNIVWRNQFRRFHVESPTGGSVLVRTTAWLAWQVDVNGDRTVGDVEGDEDGRIVVAIPPGHSDVTIRYVGTPNQRAGTLLSIVTLLGLIGFAAWAKVKPGRLYWI